MVIGSVLGILGMGRILSRGTLARLKIPCAKITSCLTFVLLICFETVLLSTVSDCTKSFYVHWNTTNPIFRIDNTDHIIDVNKGNIPFEYDQVNIICPVYTPGTHEEDAEKYIIYNVSKEEYDTCRITNPNPRIIAICDKPYKLMYFTITFRSFTPQPGGLEFQPGQDYYFISTSSKDDLHRRIGGRCSTNNMKVVFKVCCRPEDVNNRTTWSPLSSTTTTTSTTSAIISRPAVRPTVNTVQYSSRPSTSIIPTYNKPKKTGTYGSNHPNEVVKNEELILNSSSCLCPSLLVVFGLLVCYPLVTL